MPQKVFDFTGNWEKFNVPDGVKLLDVVMTGGGSGAREAGKVIGTLNVKPKDTLFVFCGKRGNTRDAGDGGAPVPEGGGRGGNGTDGEQGGNGGGGATVIRKNSSTGTILAVAGGAGGNSGDGGLGGLGGGKTGGPGGAGDGGPGAVSAATGGSQDQRGRAGTSSLGTAFEGRDADFGAMGRGGRGGGPSLNNVIGGGGGGGGYRSGGGGQAGRRGKAPAGGGGGGSSFIDLLSGAQDQQGQGGTDSGRVKFSWIDPDDPNKPPDPPENITINGQSITDGLATKATNSVIVRGTPDDPNSKQGVRMYLRLSDDGKFANAKVFKGTYDEVEKRDKVTVTGLVQNTLYHLRIHTQDKTGLISPDYRSTTFWTNRSPGLTILQAPPDGGTLESIDNVTFQWNHQDVDPSDSQTAFRFRYRTARTPTSEPSEWTQIEVVSDQEQRIEPAGTFKSSTLYEWQVKTRDEQGAWGMEWSPSSSFFIEGATQPPVPVFPVGDEVIFADLPLNFEWQFKSPSDAVLQSRADLRYRVRGTSSWTTVTGDASIPGPDTMWTFDAETFGPGERYEWQVRTYSTSALVSDWSDSATFFAATQPGTLAGSEVVESGQPAAPLGIGDNRVYVYDRGGEVMRRELQFVDKVTWSRKRDDISSATIMLSDWDEETRAFLGTLRSWLHEIVIFRDGVRVWEGPILRISGSKTRLEIEAKDAMAYLYRRILRQGYNDNFRVVNGVKFGLTPVPRRAARIALNALIYDDPNVLPYLTELTHPDDAPVSRKVPAFSRTAWEEIDDLAANNGLDYTVVGRRIVFWDTHQPIGRLPEMRDGDFSDDLVITEYGASAANVFAVTTSTAIYGVATKGLDENGLPGDIGFIEQLASAYGDSEAEASSQALTRAARNELEASLREQANRNISSRWPPPVHVRVPDNSSLNPTLNITINQLVPGVWIPLRAQETVREIVQWQKLDSLTVMQDGSGERIAVVMSPAPNEGADPDAEVEAI